MSEPFGGERWWGWEQIMERIWSMMKAEKKTFFKTEKEDHPEALTTWLKQIIVIFFVVPKIGRSN